MIFVHNGDFVDVVPVSVIEKIRAEIEQIEPLDYPCDKREPEHIRDMALEIIDRYIEQEPCDDAEQIDYHDDFETALRKIHDYEERQKSCDDVVSRQLKIGDEIYIRANVNEIRNDYIICENKGGYFGTVREEIYPSVQPKRTSDESV